MHSFASNDQKNDTEKGQKAILISNSGDQDDSATEMDQLAKDGSKIDQTDYEPMKRFIEDAFSYKDCCYFKPKKPTSVVTDETQCQCGELWKFHSHPSEDETPPDEAWSRDKHIQTYKPTNAYGRIAFLTEHVASREPTHYIRLSDKDSLDDTIRLMLNYWKLREPHLPSLCLSVIGGAKNFQLTGRKRDVFQQGFVKAAQTTGAWIITSGLNLGVTKVVGEALSNSEAFHFEKKRICHQLRCIGISPWGYVLDKESLLNKTQSESDNVKNYNVSNKISSGEPVSLNPYHTHYLLVDDGIRRSYGGSKSAYFRAQLERKIALAPGVGGLGVPVVLIILEGGHDVFLDCSNSIKEKVPVVICNHTGRAADFLAYAARNLEPSMQCSPETRKVLDLLLEEVYKGDSARMAENVKKEKIAQAWDCLETILKDRNLLTVFDLDRNRGDDFDFVILCALLKRRDASSSCVRQMQLALTWNRVDIAELILDKEKTINMEELNECMMSALMDDRVDFVRLLLCHGFLMREFLTVQRLLSLYNEGSKRGKFDHILWFFLKHDLCKKKVTLETIEKLMNRLMGRGRFKCQVEDNGNVVENPEIVIGNTPGSQKLVNPFMDLFLWSILHFRQEMAKLLWEYVDQSIQLALVATQMYNSMKRGIPQYDTETLELMTNSKIEFERFATGVVQEGDETDPVRTELLIEGKLKSWDNISCLELAATANNRQFLSCAAAQNCLEHRWNNNIAAPIWLLTICIFFPILILFKSVVKFRKAQSQINNQQSEENADHDEFSWTKKFCLFYTSPQVKFILNVMSYIAFVLVYSYFVLFCLQTDHAASFMEYLIWIYVISMTVDQLREILLCKTPSLLGKLIEWWRFDFWYKVDLMFILLIGFAGLLGLLDESTFWFSRTFYSVGAVVAYCRLFRLCAASASLGPKLVMIAGMIQELVIFFIILAVFMCAYGVASQALLYPYRSFSPHVLIDIVYYPYWQMYGELFLEEVTGKREGCNGTALVDENGEDCPQRHFFVPILLAVYMILGNVLLMNLLIAIFAKVFDDVQVNSMEIWKYKMFVLLMEFERKPILPMPLFLLEDGFRLCRHAYKQYKQRQEKLGLRQSEVSFALRALFSENELLAFERSCKNGFIREGQYVQSPKLEDQLVEMQKKMESMSMMLEDCYQAIMGSNALENKFAVRSSEGSRRS